MEWFVKAFLKASLAWFAAGVSLGIAMAVHPAWAIYRTAHLHMNLLGFVTMMIFGVAYHVIPRFTGHPLHSRRLAGVQWWLVNAGLALFVVGLMLLPNTMYGTPARVIVGAGGVLSGVGAYLFVFNIWRTIDGASMAAPPTRTTQAPGIPLRRRAAGE
jgi:cytochrome c oxidase cbb3-type subunit 1